MTAVETDFSERHHCEVWADRPATEAESSACFLSCSCGWESDVLTRPSPETLCKLAVDHRGSL